MEMEIRKKKINFAWNWNSHFANFSATQTQQYREIHSRKLCDSFFIARLLFVSAQSWSNTLDWSNVWHESEQTTRKRYIACKIHPRSILAILHVKADLFRIFAFFPPAVVVGGGGADAAAVHSEP